MELQCGKIGLSFSGRHMAVSILYLRSHWLLNGPPRHLLSWGPKPLGAQGAPWGPMGPHGAPWGPHGAPWGSQGYQATTPPRPHPSRAQGPWTLGPHTQGPGAPGPWAPEAAGR